jgi:hypothetical protein
MSKPIQRLACALGMHGPTWYGNGENGRMMRGEPFERICVDCGAVWHGRVIEVMALQPLLTLGGWRRVAK